MNKFKKNSLVIVSIIICFLFLLTMYFCAKNTNVSYASSDQNISNEEDNNVNVSPRLFTQLSISLNGGAGKVWTTVRNDFTFLPSTVMIILQLYSSKIYCEDYHQMEMVSSSSTMDLDMGKTLTVECSTEGEQKYWLGRMRYKIDGGEWQEKVAGVGLYSSTGEFLGIN